MFFRLLKNAPLLLLIGAGLCMLLQAQAEQREVAREYDRLAAKVGRLQVTDASKFYVAPIPTDDPMHFAWRVYLPAGLALQQRAEHLSGGSTSSASIQSAGERVLRACYRFEGDSTKVFVKGFSGASESGFSDKSFAKFVQKHWREFEVESLAANGPTQYEPDEILTLLKITIPENLYEEIKQTKYSYLADRIKTKPLTLVRIGTVAAFEAEESKAGE